MSRDEVPFGMSGRPYSSEDYYPSPAVRWGWRQILLAVLLLPATDLAVRWIAPIVTSPLPRDAVIISAEFVFYGGSLAVVLAASRFSGLRDLRVDFGFDFRRSDPLWAAGLLLAILIANVISGSVVSSITGLHSSADPLPENPWLRAFESFFVLAAAPFVEELVARGLVMRAIRHSVLRLRLDASPSLARIRAAKWGSILGSAVLFSALHIPSRIGLTSLPFEITSTLIGGVLLGWVATRTGRLGPGILAHIAVNLFALSVAGG